MPEHSSRKTVFAAIAANIAIAVSKFVCAAFTGSSAMLSEGIHSLIDTGDGALILIGLRRSTKPPDELHPFGYGKELYFWSLIVAILIFALGGGMSIYEGITHIEHPKPLENVFWNYLILGLSFVFESMSAVIAYREMRLAAGSQSSWRYIRTSKDPSTFMVLVEDSAALIGLTVAFIGVFLGEFFDNPYIDGAASIVIGLILMSVAGILVHESKGLLIGEGATREVLRDIESILKDDPDVCQIGRLLTMYFGPHTALINCEIGFRPDMPVRELAGVVCRLEKRVQKRYPEMKRIFLEAASLKSVSSPSPSEQAPARKAA